MQQKNLTIKRTSILPFLNPLLEESTPEKNKKSGSMVAFYVPLNIGATLKGAAKDFEGDELETRDMHITIGLIKSEDRNEDILKTLNHFAKYLKPFSVKVNQFGVFPPSDSSRSQYVLYAKPESSAFNKIHSKIFEFLRKKGIEIDNGSFDFSPHITIKYCDQEPDIEDIRFNLNFEIDNLSFSSKGNKKVFRL